MNVGNDGSLYLNPRRLGTAPLKHGEGIADGAGGFAKVEWVQPDNAQVQDRKVSYHVSGRVKGGSRMTQSVNVRNIVGYTLIR